VGKSALQLNKIQEEFKDLILGSYDNVSQDSDFTRLFDPNKISVDTRLHVYRNNVLSKLTNVLQITYPTVHGLVGEEFFDQVSKHYIRQNPPTEGCVNLYGEGFSDFIANLEQTKNLAYLQDVTLYDWLFNAAFFADDDKGLQPDDLSKVPPEQFENIIFSFRSSAYLIESAYPLTIIREFCDPEANNKDENLDIDQGGEKLLLYRPDMKIVVLLLEDDEFFMLQFLKQQETIGAALEQTLPQYPEFNFQKFLEKVINLEIFENFQIKQA